MRGNEESARGQEVEELFKGPEEERSQAASMQKRGRVLERGWGNGQKAEGRRQKAESRGQMDSTLQAVGRSSILPQEQWLSTEARVLSRKML